MEQSEKTSGQWAERLWVNILWSWLGVFTSFLTGFFLSPYIVRKLGDSGYGIWALSFALIDYFNLFDIGLKTATVNLIATSRTRGDTNGINQLINTALFYFSGIYILVCGVTWLAAGQLHRVFQVSAQYQDDFTTLIRLIAFGWTVLMISNVFLAGVEGFQLFQAQSRIQVASLLFRTGGYCLLLYLGYGLVEMGMLVTISQCINAILLFIVFRRAFPQLEISARLVSRDAWRKMTGYGKYVFAAFVGSIAINQGPAITIGLFLPEAFVGYYAMPSRLLTYVVELVTRLGTITMPNTVELSQQGRRSEIVQLGTYLNRYCFALFVPLSIFLLVYGRDLLGVWMGAGFALYAAPLLPAFVLATALAVAGQYNTSAILFGLSEHALYAKLLVIEAVLMLAGVLGVMPVWGMRGAAWVAAAFAILNRGMLTPWLMCRALNHSLLVYLRSIYTVPVLWCVPAVLYAYWLHSRLPGNSWWQLFPALALITGPMYVALYFTAVERKHRTLLASWIRKRLPGARSGSAL